MARNITRYDPMSDMVRTGMFPDIGNLFREFALSPSFRGMEVEPRMKIDIEDADQSYVVKADVPGVKKEDINVSIEGNMVTIRADVREEKKTEKGNMIRTERYFGEEVRTFALPQDVDDAKAEAKYENGVLMLTLPKKAGTGGKKLTIQ